MQTRAQKRVLWGGLFVVLLGAAILKLGAIANGPDRDIVFVREVDSKLDAKTLHQAIRVVLNWPKWHFNMADVRLVDFRGESYAQVDQALQAGSLIRFKVEPPTKQWKRFEMMGEATEFTERSVAVRLVGDSTGRLLKLFDRAEWRIDLLPEPGGAGTKIRGTMKVHTASWKSRLFGTITERVLMNQVFYPDLEKLATLTQPVSVDPLPQSQQ